MADDSITLRRGTSGATYSVVESDKRFVVHFKSAVPGGTAAKSLLKLPLMFGRRVHPRKMPMPPRVAMFEVRPDEASKDLPLYGDDPGAIRDASMNFIRSLSGKSGSVVAACYHTYARVPPGGNAKTTNRDNELFPSGQLFLEFHSAVADEEQRRVLDHYKLLVDRAITYWPGAFVVSVSNETGESPVRLAAELQQLRFQVRVRGSNRARSVPLFDYADPLFHRRRDFAALPTDSLFPYQWHLRNDGSDGGVAGADIAVTEAWDYTRGEPGVRVAVIDDGFELTHPDIGAEGRIVAPLDAMNGSSDPSPTSGADQWHGTSVLGLICAAHNGRGASGVAPLCEIIPIKLDALSDDEAEARAFDHAVANGAAVINCSWGPYDDYSRETWPMPRLVELAIENAYQNDVCVVFAAGNGNEEIASDGYASHDHVITVAASTDQNQRAYYSDFGEQVWVCAPSSGGKRAVVTTDMDDGGENPFGSYSSGFGGTSSAAPLVSGVIALMQSVFAREHGPGNRLGVEQIKTILRETATKIDQDGKDFYEYWERKPISVGYDEKGHSVAYGYGLVNAAGAVRAALAQPARLRSAPATIRPRSDTVAKGETQLRARRVGDPFALFGSDRGTAVKETKDRYESGEHIWLGDRGFELALKSDALEGKVRYDDYKLIHRQDQTVSFRYGEIVALSGDFYGSPGDLFYEKPGAVPWLWEKNDLSDVRAAFATELDAIRQQQQGARFTYPDNNMTYWWNTKAYVELALDNTAHFGWHNLQAYCLNHTEALRLARAARKMYESDVDKAGELMRQALFTNAFADHFLTDGFAAGHIRVPRAEIRMWSTAQGYNEKLAGALSKLLHDQDGHIDSVHGEGHSMDPHDHTNDNQGLPVLNSRGERWLTRCDGQLFIRDSEDDPIIQMPVQAVKASVTEVFRAYLFDELPEKVYAATQFVPFPDPQKPGLAEKFSVDTPAARIKQLLDATKWYMKVPYLSAGIEEKHIRSLFQAIPQLLSDFTNAAKAEVDGPEQLSLRLPEPLIAGFFSLK